ncbi:copper type II ascorbate-dependent monooxygenase domain protein [Dictyocaulus viviparus]|uniref:Copper type II ascorbate-dependent monooxygenase domain protein n=1 Tax=Dictyocaulus viviparus TaxID=29172 RepID=A0A0D8XF77_DICVI|nr:copper type II ascorbate-dependent monooxygenase domain protein [Dictyocaulus viviparus]
MQTNFRLAYLIIGFSDHGSYNNSDICIYRNNKLRDGYIDANFQIQFDRSQDCQLEKRNRNTFSFRRRLATCDPYDIFLESGTTQFILAGGYEFSRNFNSDNVMKMSIIFEMKFGNLFQTDSTQVLEFESAHFKILADGARISHDVTTYWCVIKRIPVAVSRQKHHIIQIMPQIQKGNEQLVHHMEVFMCESDDQVEYSGKCDSLARFRNAQTCSHVVAAWAMGEEPIFYPPEAGLPIGGVDGKKYLKVEIHYNNPARLVDIRDDSGFDIVITPNLRKFDAGIMELGIIYSDANSIPPNQASFPLTGHCVADCTMKLSPAPVMRFEISSANHSAENLVPSLCV